MNTRRNLLRAIPALVGGIAYGTTVSKSTPQPLLGQQDRLPAPVVVSPHDARSMAENFILEAGIAFIQGLDKAIKRAKLRSFQPQVCAPGDCVNLGYPVETRMVYLTEHLIHRVRCYDIFQLFEAKSEWPPVIDQAKIKGLVAPAIARMAAAIDDHYIGFRHSITHVPPHQGMSWSTRFMSFSRVDGLLVCRRLPMPMAGLGVIGAYAEQSNLSARVLLSFCPNTLGYQITFDMVYGHAGLPSGPEKATWTQSTWPEPKPSEFKLGPDGRFTFEEVRTWS